MKLNSGLPYTEINKYLSQGRCWVTDKSFKANVQCSCAQYTWFHANLTMQTECSYRKNTQHHIPELELNSVTGNVTALQLLYMADR